MKKDKVLAAYQRAINRIEDVTEYRVAKPPWLKEILLMLEKELKATQENK